MVTRTALGLGERDPRLHQFTAETFEVRSRSGKAFAGIDGEALELDTPLEFRTHPRALRMLVPGDVLADSAQRRARGFNPGRLVAVALGGRGGGSARRRGPAEPERRRDAVTGAAPDRRSRRRLRPRRDAVPLRRRAPELAGAGAARPRQARSIACGIDRSKADVAAAHRRTASYSDYLRRRIEKAPPPTS